MRNARRWLLIGLFVYFTLLGGTLTTEFNAWARIVHHALLTALFAVWCVQKYRHNVASASPLDVPALLLFAAYGLATLFAVNPRVSLEALWLLGVHLLLIVVAIDIMRGAGPATLMTPALFTTAVVILIGLIEIAAWYFGIPILPLFETGWFEIGGLQQPLPPQSYRVQFTMSVPTTLSAYLGLMIPVGIAWLITTHRRSNRQAMALWLVGAFVIEGFSFSRGGLLSLAVSLPALGLLYAAGDKRVLAHVRRWLRDWRVWLAGAVLVGVLGLLAAGWTTQNLEGHRAGDAQRLDLWRSALQIGADHPLWGVGPYGYGRALRSYRNPQVTADHIRTPHNALLLVWSEAGVVGLLAFVSLLAAVGRAGYHRWRQAAGREKVRVAGVIAGLAGFSAHNMVDNFPITPLLFSAAVLVAYLVYPLPARITAHRGSPRLAAALIGGLLALSGVMWLVFDTAQVHFARSLRLADQQQLTGALAAIGTARRIDPQMGMYAAQEAQYLAELAQVEPAILPRALAAHEALLADVEATFDVMHANYAMLLDQQGDTGAALAAMSRAAHIQPTRGQYWLWSGMYAERLAQVAVARQAYQRALESATYWQRSPFWALTPLRADVLAEAAQPPDPVVDRLRQRALEATGCWLYVGDPQAESRGERLTYEGLTLLLVDDNPALALPLLDRAVAADRTNGDAHIARAVTLLALRRYPEAEQAAQTAIFLDGFRHAHCVLGTIYEQQGLLSAAEAAYLAGGPVVVQSQAWEVAVYGRRGRLRLLEALDAPGPPLYEGYFSWLALIDLYVEQGRMADAAVVRQILADVYPYHDIPASE